MKRLMRLLREPLVPAVQDVCQRVYCPCPTVLGTSLLRTVVAAARGAIAALRGQPHLDTQQTVAHIR